MRAKMWATTVACGALLALAGPAGAQGGPVEPRCASNLTGPNAVLLDACQKVFDIFRFMTPQVGVALAGGNTIPGETGTLGGPSKASLSVRVTAIDGFIPSSNANISTAGSAVASNLGAKRAPVPMASADFSIGLFQGRTVGLTNFGGVDLLVGVVYVPKVNDDAISLKPTGNGFAASYGVRFGLLQESAVVPGVSVSYRVRKLPNTNIQFTSDDDTLRVNSAAINAKSLRIVAGKHYRFLGLAGGVGRDEINAKSFFNASIHNGPIEITSALPSAQDRVKRNNAFLNLSLGLPKLQLVGEVGWSAAGNVRETVNTFDTHKANEKFRYYSVGFTYRP